MNLDLSGRRAIVCGSTRGIGRAAAIELASLGAAVTLMARDRAALDRVLADLPRPSDQQHSVLVADLSSSDSTHESIASFVSTGDEAHILINNTGGPPPGQAIDAEPQAFLAAFTAHLVASQVLVRALAPGMKSAGYGRVINVISTSVRQPIPGLGVSNTVRGAVASWAKTLSMELAHFGVTVNNVLPGFTETERLGALIQNKAKASGRPAEAIADEMRRTVPAGRFAKPEEIAFAIAFLASPAASYINGVSLAVDGGRTSTI